VATNSGELNPVQWNWQSPATYFGVAGGGLLGYVGGWYMFNGGGLGLAAGITTPVGGVYLTGQGSNWSFQWTTTAGGGGSTQITGNRAPSAAQVVDQQIESSVAAYRKYFTGSNKYVPYNIDVGPLNMLGIGPVDYFDHNYKNGAAYTWSGFKMAWNNKILGRDFPDLFSVDFHLSSTAAGGGSVTYTANFLTRGEFGLHLTRTSFERGGGEIDWGFNFNMGTYLGNPYNIKANTLLGLSKTVSLGLGNVGFDATFGYKNGRRIWFTGGVGLGFGAGLSGGKGNTVKGWW